ncbi:uncharacterized protein BYT42DRAFT_562382 [Radiomyces spectabilis]|uniref:uncharacterized protein n=1 Tax=Radiomyces spectabilis TaxID=64574 RepID=UPI00221F7150|nr:uncharacterized protein BYT42DRAFT_562382 [Radiomyces spectabilis]KAI8384394.1 hypothetical protein BYT42DRAFT_562382 [Radiomyces spectabilis]
MMRHSRFIEHFDDHDHYYFLTDTYSKHEGSLYSPLSVSSELGIPVAHVARPEGQRPPSSIPSTDVFNSPDTECHSSPGRCTLKRRSRVRTRKHRCPDYHSPSRFPDYHHPANVNSYSGKQKHASLPFIDWYSKQKQKPFWKDAKPIASLKSASLSLPRHS